jgi:hypothetical protein
MKKVTTESLVRNIAKDWDDQYSYPNVGEEKREISRRLSMLNPETATAADVESIIGNGTWTSIRCDECNRKVASAINFEPVDGYTPTVCESCLEKAVLTIMGKI